MQIIKNLAQNEDIILKCKSNIRRCFLLIGEALRNIKEGNLWQSTGCNSFYEYGENVHGLKKSSIAGLVQVFETFGKEIDGNPEYQNINYTRLIELAPIVTEDNKIELLHAAARIPDSKGWDNTVRNLRHKVGTDDPHEHNWIPVNLERCSVCNLKRMILR